MNQRSTFSRTKEPRREKIIRTRRDDGERTHGDEPPSRRSSTERSNSTHVSSYSRYKESYSEKSRSNSRDSQGSLVFRRQERNKTQSNFSKGEISPGRLPHSDTMRLETSGRLNYGSQYNRGFNARDRDYTSKRPGLLDNNHIIDETRLKSYLHRLLRDEDRERQASLIRQLKIAFEHPENYKVILSNRDVIISTFEDFVQLGLNSELKYEFICAVGTLGAVLGNKSKSLLDWEFNIIGTSKCEDLRILMLKSQLEMLRMDAEKQTLSELVPFIMTRLQSTLEVADVPDLLIAIVNVIFEISSYYPAVFSNHFSDIVDILIGWHIDASQQQSVIDFTSSALIGFQQFWISDINFTVTLLGQFLEDMESYAEGLPKINASSKKSVKYLKELAQCKLNSSGSTETVPSAAENIAKIKSLIRVLITVLRSIEDLIAPEENGVITWRFVVEMLKNFLKYVTKTVDYNYYCDLMTSANECLDLILKLAQSHSKDALNELMSYVDLLQSRSSNLYESHLVSILKVMIRFVKSVGTYLPVRFVTKLFSDASLTRQLRLSPSSSVQKLLIELYHVVLAVKNVQIVEEFYKCILVDIMEAHTMLLKTDHEDLVDVPQVKNAEASLLLSICTLVEIGNIKHSLIRMFALKPSFFELMTCQLKPTAPELAKRYPALQSSILYILYSHSQRHSHFVNSSVLVNPNAASGSPVSTSGQNSPIMTDIPPTSPSSANLGKIIKLLIELLEGQCHSYDSRLLATKWTHEILESVQRHIARLVQNSQFTDLMSAVINASLTSDTAICKACCKSLHLFLKSASSVLPQSILQRCYDLCIIRLSSHDPQLQDQFANLLPLLPLDIVLTANSVSFSKGGFSTKDIDILSKGCSSIFDIWTLYRGYMSRSYAGNFFNHHFRAITNFVLLGKEPQEKKWLLRMFYSCPPAERYSKVDALFVHLSSASNAALWFWAMWEVAQFCVSYKLRTPLGKPQETFMAIEAALKSSAKMTKNNDDSFLSESRYTTLFRVNLLLSLLENLEKLMYNAYEGCAVAFPSPPKVVRTFFRTNKSTCHEWLSRVRSTAVTVSFSSGCYAAAVRHGFELLQELKNNNNTQGPEFDSALYSVVKALISLHCPDAVLGLYLWCKDKIGRKLTWIKASVDCAAGRFEDAADEYICVYHALSEGSTPQKKGKPLEEMKAFEKSSSPVGDPNEDSGSQVNKLDQSFCKPAMDAHLHTFLINQAIECYVSVQNWTEASKWAVHLEKMKGTQNGINLPNNLTYLRCLSSFEESSNLYSKKEINSLKSDLTRNSEYFDISSWNMTEQFNKAQRLLMSVAMDYDSKNRSIENMQDISEHIHDAQDRILKLMKLSTLNWPPQIDSRQVGLFVSTSLFQSPKKAPSLILRENMKLDPADCYSSTLGFLLTWENIWLSLNPGSPPKLQNGYFDLLMTSIRLARKQQNFKMCFRLISKQLNFLCKSSDLCNSASTTSAMADNLKNRLKKSFSGSVNEKLLRTQREGAKLLRCLGESENAFDVLLHSICVVSQYLKDPNNQLQGYTVEQLSELNSRSMLNLVKYVQLDAKSASVSLDNSPDESNWKTMLYNCVNDLKHSSREVSGLNKNFISELEQEKVVGDSDYVIGQLLQLSIYQCPMLAKSWYNFASWCYSWGRKVVSTSGVSMNMLPEEKSKITSLVPGASRDDINSLINAVSNLHTSSGGEWDGQEMDYSENSLVEIKFQLITCCPFLLKVENSDAVIDGVLEVWKNLARRAYSYYRMAAMSYLQYLHLTGKVSNRDRSEDDNVTATLRLLRLVVKHALELRDVLEEGLAETPTAPWRGIIPQLFSRLNHPEPYVRQSISDLLCRVAQGAPHLIVFPAVVGSLTLKVGPQLQEEAAGLFRVYLPDSSEDATESQADGSSQASPCQEDGLEHPPDGILSEEEDVTSEEDRQKTAVMQNCFTALVETLGSQDERTISETKNLIHELHRITLLWDELWLGTLNMHQSEVNRRFSNLEKEICKVMNNGYLSKEEKKEIIKEKHSIYVKPTLFLLEQLQTITTQPAETPHEQWFQKTFEKHIENAVNKLQNPSDPSRPQESWSVFKQLYQLLQQKVQQQSRSHLSMDHISPVLASLKNTVIPMPGINKPTGVITIQSVHHVVSILPTKTKPKKLAFIGSDGHRYTYLFKGLEDLHLDERIMQFLSIVNNMFLKSKRYAKEVYYARHYSVTPLGPRSGLIQWVDGATPLFGLYKRWQQREANSLALKGQNSGGNVGAVLRPSEIYYNKLTPLLKEKNLNCVDNRKEWPLSVMLEVLNQLMEETPNYLLAKELWCSCSSALEWWNVTLTYNHSTAVMSIIGYIIGLGDRHLDNVLVDLATGEVVHIDYNVCFEKGKNLRVPEKVPFRMTQNITTALGLTGIEGVFRTSCEHVLKVLRRGKETLLTLLEAFVYDPLVDWTPGSEGGYTGAVYGGRQAWGATEAKQTRQGMELDIAFSMFAVRVAEMRGEWMKNRDELLAAFPKLEVLLQEWKNAQINLQQTETELQDACQEKALLEEALLNPTHNLYTVPKRYEETSIVKTAVSTTKEAVMEKLNECKKWHNMHCESLLIVCGSELAKWCSDVSNDLSFDALSVAPVEEFLQSAGQGQLVQQCEHAENELASAAQQRRLTMRNCIDLLTTYATIVLQFGPGYKEQNRCFKWQKWLESLHSDFTSLKCIEILSDFRNHYGRESTDAIQSAVSMNLQFQSVLSDINAKVLSIIDRMRLDGLDDKQALVAFVEETKCSIVHYLADSGKPGHLAFLCVVVEALCAIQKQLFIMEAGAADRLADFSTWNGDWYMNEMYCGIGSVARYIQLVLDSCGIESAELKSGLQGVKLAHFVFSSLEDLCLHFQNIILPEAIQTALEPSVIEMVAKLDRIIARCGVPLEKLISDLETNIANLILKTQISESRVSDTVKKLRNEFESLMQRTEPQITGLNQGQMLLMGFNGLFTKIDSDLEALLTYLDSLPVPASWQKLDIYRDTVALAPPVHHPSSRLILKDIYFVRKLLAMQQSFHVCHSFAAALHIHHRSCHIVDRDAAVLTADHQLVKPVKQFTLDYIRHVVVGLPSRAIGFALCFLFTHMGYDLSTEIDVLESGSVCLEDILMKCYKSCMTDNFLLPPITSLLGAFDGAWRKEDIARRFEHCLVVARGSQQRTQLQYARFQWLNEDLLVQGNAGPNQGSSVPSRATVMSEIRKSVGALATLDCVVSSAHERYLNLTSGIEQRLKWAAGANPSLAAIQAQFESAIAAKTAIVNNTNHLSHELANVCNAILHFEALRTRTSEALSSDNGFLALINRCKETCELAESCQSQISPIEEHLISLKPLDSDGITAEWLTSVIKKVSQTLTACREKLEHQKSVSTLCWESLHLQVVSVHEVISLHHKLMSEVRHILRNLAKHEELGLGPELKSEGQVHRYMSLYKDFSERISAIVSKIAEAQEIELTGLSAIENELPLLSVSASEVYNQLLELAGPLGNRKNGLLQVDAKQSHSKKNFLCPSHDASALHSPGVRPKTPMKYGTPKKLPIMRDPRTGKAVQERNTYATNVWKRVKMKLEGRDPESNKKSSVPDQVDYVIREATNPENLAVLYEGWTPWV